MKEEDKNKELLNHESDVDITGIWAAIEPEVDALNASRRRKKIIWWFTLGAGFLVLGGFAYFMSFGLTTNDRMMVDSSTNISSKTRQIEENEGIKSKVLTNKNIEGQEKNDANNLADLTSNESVKTTISKLPLPLSQISETKLPFDNQAVKSGIQENEKTTFDNRSSLVLTENTIIERIDLAPAKDEKDEKDENLKTPLVSPLLSNQLKRLPNPEIIDLSLNIKMVQAKSSKMSSNFNFDLGTFYGLSSISRELAIKNDAEGAVNTLNLRQESETLLEAQLFGINSKVTHKSGLSVQVGFQQTVISERYDNMEAYTEIDTTFGLKERIINLNGDTTDIFGTIMVFRTYNYEKQIFNRYQLLDIPVILGYEFQKEKWSFGVQAGGFLNLRLKTTGQVRVDNITDLNIGTSQNDIFKNSLGFSTYAGLNIAYTTDNNLRFSVAPNLRIFSDDFAVADYALSQKYKLFGIQARVAYVW